MSPLPRPTVVSETWSNLLALPSADILNLLLFAAAIGHRLPFTVFAGSQNVIWTCLAKVVDVHFWHGMFSTDLDLENFRIIRPSWIEFQNSGTKTEIRLVRLIRERYLGLLADCYEGCKGKLSTAHWFIAAI
jgi:hypothetical protein